MEHQRSLIAFRTFEEFPGWGDAPGFFKSLISEYECRRILEVGSGANPTLPAEYVRSTGLNYVTNDLSAEELVKADSAFEQLVLDLSTENLAPELTGSFDCVLSRMVGEHVKDGARYYRNIFRLLRAGGITAHCFSTLWCLPFAANRFMPDFASELLLNFVAPRDRHQHGKFKAYYSWSRGPSKQMVSGFENLGFQVLNYTGYFGHPYYRSRMPWLDRLETLKTRALVNHPVPQLCSYATLVLRKP